MNFIRRVLSPAVFAGLLLMAFTAGVYAQTERLGKIAVLPFSGGSTDEREGIPELMITPEMMQNFTVIPRTGITAAARREEYFQTMSGMTDAKTIAELGNQFGADYVMAGSITSLGTQNLLIVSITKIDVIRQVAGVYLTYNSLDELSGDQTILKSMATELVEMARSAGDELEKLALLPVAFESEANRQEGDALAQLLSIHLLRAGKYAVYPRTETLEKVQDEYKTQLESGVTRVDERVKAGEAVNPPYVLSVISRKIGTDTRFIASIIELETEGAIAGDSELYANMRDGIAAMEFLARRLSGDDVSQAERNRRTDAVDREREMEATKKATDKFLQNSGIVLGGWAGPGFGTGAKTHEEIVTDKETGKPKTENGLDPSFAGGPTIELRYRWSGIQTGITFGIQTGITFLTDHPSYTPPGGEEQYATVIFVQIPVLARFNFNLVAEVRDEKFPAGGLGVALFGGVGMNVGVTSISDAESADPGGVSFIVGGEVFIHFSNFMLSLGVQFNGGNSGSVNGTSYDRKSVNLCFGLGFYVPFRKR